MWQKNDEIIAKDEIQFRFTNYLLTAIRRKRKDYLSKICSCMEHEVVIDELLYQSDKAEYDELNTFMLMQRLDNTSLWHALSDLVNGSFMFYWNELWKKKLSVNYPKN